MGASHDARLGFGIIGQFTSLALFVAPVDVCWKMFKAGTTLEFSPLPYIAALLNCVFWIFYGSKKVQKDGLLVMTINGVGAGLEVIYIVIFFWFAARKVKKQMALLLFAVTAIAVVVIVTTAEAEHKRSNRKTIMGLVSDVFCILMYAAPLSTMLKVIRTKSAESLPLYLSLTLIANGAIWSLYALMPGYFDPYILVPNGLGFFLSILQVILYYIYRNGLGASDLEKQAEVKVGIESNPTTNDVLDNSTNHTCETSST